MQIQSLSVVVPNRQCVNACRFCVSRMRAEEYKNQLDENLPFYDLYLRDYLKRLEFARDNGCNTVMLTGNTEPQQNRRFLKDFGIFNEQLERPFRNIEMQTTGVLLDESYLRFLRNHVGVCTISLSLSSLDDAQNAAYNATPEGMAVDIAALCALIRKYDFNLRLSLNLTDAFEALGAAQIFERGAQLGSNQITLRVLYSSGGGTEQDLWIARHAASAAKLEELRGYIHEKGRALERLEYGAMRYSVHNLSVVLDEDCMSEEAKQAVKYLILRPDCKLYSKWDESASLVF